MSKFEIGDIVACQDSTDDFSELGTIIYRTILGLWIVEIHSKRIKVAYLESEMREPTKLEKALK